MNRYQKEYISRINRVISYVEANLGNDLSVNKLAGVAHFSPFHFHRIFSAFTGEPLISYVKRKRIEKAASILLQDNDISVSEVSEKCGYNSLSVFCRNFKDHYNMSAQDFRNEWPGHFSKNSQTEGKIRQSDSSGNDYVYSIESLKPGGILMKSKFEIKEMSSLNLVYTSHVGNFDGIGAAYEKLMRWAGPRGLLSSPSMKTATVYHDDPTVTDIAKVRQSACITVEGDVKTEGEFGKLSVPGGKYVVGSFEINDQEFGKAWDSVCVWLAESGYQPGDGLPYELYHNDHMEHPERKFIVDICIPVKPL